MAKNNLRKAQRRTATYEMNRWPRENRWVTSNASGNDRTGDQLERPIFNSGQLLAEMMIVDEHSPCTEKR